MFGEKHWQCAHGAIITILILLLILLVPVLILGQLVLGELADLYNSLRGAHITQAQILEKLPEQLQPFAAEFLNDLGSKVGGFSEPNFQRLKSGSLQRGWLLLAIFLVFSLSIILRDGQQIRILPKILPMSESKENLLVNKLSEAVAGVVKGSFGRTVPGRGCHNRVFNFRCAQPFLWGMFAI